MNESDKDEEHVSYSTDYLLRWVTAPFTFGCTGGKIFDPQPELLLVDSEGQRVTGRIHNYEASFRFNSNKYIWYLFCIYNLFAYYL